MVGEEICLLVHSSEDTLYKKFSDGLKKEGKYCHWDLQQFPTKIRAYPERQIRLYVAVNRIVKGYFKIFNYDEYSAELFFYSEDWYPIASEEKFPLSTRWIYYIPKEIRAPTYVRIGPAKTGRRWV